MITFEQYKSAETLFNQKSEGYPTYYDNGYVYKNSTKT